MGGYVEPGYSAGYVEGDTDVLYGLTLDEKLSLIYSKLESNFESMLENNTEEFDRLGDFIWNVNGRQTQMRDDIIEEVHNIEIDSSLLAKESTLNSVSSKIDNIDIDTTDLAKEATLNSLSTKVDDDVAKEVTLTSFISSLTNLSLNDLNGNFSGLKNGDEVVLKDSTIYGDTVFVVTRSYLAQYRPAEYTIYFELLDKDTNEVYTNIQQQSIIRYIPQAAGE